MSEAAVQNPNQPSQPSQPSQPVADGGFAVPETYKDKPWVQSVKSVDDLWKLNDNAQSLIGKRPAGIPPSDAPDEDWNKFFNAMGRPEKPEGYELPEVEGLPEGADITAQKQMALSIMHEAGLSPRQAAKLWQSYMKAELESTGKVRASFEEKQKALDAEYEKIVADTFGDKYDAASLAAQDLIKRHVPAEMIPAYESLADNPQAMAAVIKALSGAQDEIANLKKEFGAEGKLTSGNQAQSQSIDEVRQELAKLRTSREARDFTNPEHKKVMQRIEELSGVVKGHYG